jgi:hypothetical protein
MTFHSSKVISVFKKSLRCLLRVNCEHYLTHTKAKILRQIGFVKIILLSLLYTINNVALARHLFKSITFYVFLQKSSYQTTY